MKIDQLKQAVGKNLDQVLEICTRIWSVPAIGPEYNGEGESARAELLMNLLEETTLFPTPRLISSPDSRVGTGLRPNIIYRFDSRKQGPCLWFLLHLDVVAPGDLSQWETDPFNPVRKGDQIFGRGSEDNGAGLASVLLAHFALSDGQFHPAHNYGIVLVSDEEVSSRHGILYLLEQPGIFGPEDLFLVPDGGDNEGMEIEAAEKGLLWLKVTVTGDQVHASRPDLGRNAVRAGAALMGSLCDMENYFSKSNPLFNPETSTFVPTRRESADTPVNIIPGRDVFYMDCRVLPDYELVKVTAEAYRRGRQIAETFGVEVTIEVIDKTEPSMSSTDHPLPARLRASLMCRRGKEPRLTGSGGSTVAAYLRQAGYPAYVWSTIDNTAHQPNEYMRISFAEADAVVIADLLLDNLPGMES